MPTSIQILPNGDVLGKRSGVMSKVRWYIVLPDVPKTPKERKETVKKKEPKPKPVLPHMKLGWPKNLIERELDIYDVEITSEDFEEKIRNYQRLTEREKEMLFLYYKNGMTYEQVAKQFGVTRERVRQIVVKSIRKLRSTSGLVFLFGEGAKESKYFTNRLALPDELSRRERNALYRAGVYGMREFVGLTLDDLLNIKWIGKQSAEHIMEVVEKYR